MAKASARRRTNQLTTLGCTPKGPPQATPRPTSTPKARQAPGASCTQVAMDTAPSTISKLPSMTVRRPPIERTNVATSSAGTPDITV